MSDQEFKAACEKLDSLKQQMLDTLVGQSFNYKGIRYEVISHRWSEKRYCTLWKLKSDVGEIELPVKEFLKSENIITTLN